MIAEPSGTRSFHIPAPTLPAAIIFGGAIPAALGPHALASLGGGLVLLFSMYAGTRFAWTLLATRPRPVRLFAWFYFYIFLGLAPLVQKSGGKWAIPSTHPNGHAVINTALIVFLFVGAWDLAGIFVSRRGLSVRVRPARLELSTKRTWLLAPVALAIALYEVRQLGGAGQLFTSRADRGASLQSLSSATRGIETALLTFPVFVCACLLQANGRSARNRRLDVGALLLTLVALVLANPAGSSRYVVATVYIGLAFSWVWPLTRRQMVTGGVALLVALFVLFPALNYFPHRCAYGGGGRQRVAAADARRLRLVSANCKYRDVCRGSRTHVRRTGTERSPLLCAAIHLGREGGGHGGSGRQLHGLRIYESIRTGTRRGIYRRWPAVGTDLRRIGGRVLNVARRAGRGSSAAPNVCRIVCTDLRRVPSDPLAGIATPGNGRHSCNRGLNRPMHAARSIRCKCCYSTDRGPEHRSGAVARATRVEKLRSSGVAFQPIYLQPVPDLHNAGIPRHIVICEIRDVELDVT